jgi:hypothetical protein
MRRTILSRVFALHLTMLGACADRGDQNGQAADTSEAAGDSAMPGMQGMQGTAMMQQMQSHMSMMQGMGADSMQAMLPMHRQMLANMIAQMNREMRDMNMPADAEWNSVTDSLRQDLVRMPEMGAQELQTFMPEHHRRMTRLMDMHREMMSRMRM